MPPPEPPIDYDDTPNQKSALSRRAPLKPANSVSTEGSSSLNNGTRSNRNVLPGKTKNSFENNPDSSIKSADSTLSRDGFFSGSQFVAAANRENQEPLARKSPHRQTVTKKTRSYVVDGVQITTTTQHVLGVKQDHELRKREMQNLKRMQREEARQQQELAARAEQLREQQEKRFNQEKMNVQRSYETEIEMISRAQKRKIEDLERAQEEELKAVARKIKAEQEKELRAFRARLKQDQKIMKQEVDMLPKSQRKDVMKMRKDQLDRMQNDKELEFVTTLEQNNEVMLARLREKHREKMALVERQILEQKHQLERSMNSALWELEEKQLAERNALIAQQLKEVFMLQRSQMIARHHKEQEHVRKINQAAEENLMRALAADRKRLPKALKNDSRTRTMMFKESLRIDRASADIWAERIQEFEDREKKRIKQALEEHDAKCKRRMDSLIKNNQAILNELEEAQNEKRSMLLQNENDKLAQYDQEYQQLVREFRSSLPTRKNDLERKFTDEMEKQEKFYNVDLPGQSMSG
uniref:Uncharacterized protein n=1 Tax=Acrobeloides nanus TaxID=290746 RepID=A0A914CWV8_9BILA